MTGAMWGLVLFSGCDVHHDALAQDQPGAQELVAQTIDIESASMGEWTLLLAEALRGGERRYAVLEVAAPKGCAVTANAEGPGTLAYSTCEQTAVIAQVVDGEVLEQTATPARIQRAAGLASPDAEGFFVADLDLAIYTDAPVFQHDVTMIDGRARVYGWFDIEEGVWKTWTYLGVTSHALAGSTLLFETRAISRGFWQWQGGGGAPRPSPSSTPSVAPSPEPSAAPTEDGQAPAIKVSKATVCEYVVVSPSESCDTKNMASVELVCRSGCGGVCEKTITLTRDEVNDYLSAGSKGKPRLPGKWWGTNEWGDDCKEIVLKQPNAFKDERRECAVPGWREGGKPGGAIWIRTPHTAPPGKTTHCP